MSKPWHLYITNGATQTEKLEFEDRIHYIVHYNQVEDFRMYICGREFASFSCNVRLSFDEFIYILSRLRWYTLPESFKGSPFPVYVANWEGGVLRVSIGKSGFTFRKPRVDQRELLLEAWNEWLDTHND